MYFGKIFASWETHPHAEREFKRQQPCMIHIRVQRLNSEEPMHTYIHSRYKDDVDKEVNIETELQLKKI